jgi:hypothetical protein
MSLLGIPFAFCLPGDVRRLEWREARPSYCRRAGCRYGASSHRCGVDVDCSFRTRPCVSLLAPRIQTMKMGNDPIADRFCSSLRLVSVWMIRPQARFSRTLTLLFAIRFFLVVMAP